MFLLVLLNLWCQWRQPLNFGSQLIFLCDGTTGAILNVSSYGWCSSWQGWVAFDVLL